MSGDSRLQRDRGTNTSHHRIVRQVSEVISTLLEDGVEEVFGRNIQVVTGPPLREKFTRMPALGIYLYRAAVLFEHREQDQILVSKIDEAGQIADYWQEPGLLLGLDYLVSAWADDDPEQQELLGAALYALQNYPVIEGEVLDGDAFDPDDRIYVRPIEELSVEFLMSLWRGFGEHLRPSAAYRCRLRMGSPRRSRQIVRVSRREIVYES